MKTATSVILLFVCTVLALGLIIALGREPSAPSAQNPDHITSEPTSATDGKEPPANVFHSYSAAVEALTSAETQAYTYTYDQSRQVGSEIFTETRAGTAAYTGLHTDAMEALVSEDVVYNSFNTHYTDSFTGGRAYCQLRGSTFACDISADVFLAQHIPAVLLDEQLYQQTDVSENHLEYTFSNPIALESWVDSTGAAELITATGAAILDESGQLATASYHAEYTLGTIAYTLDVSITITGTPDLSAQPEYSGDYPLISDLAIPRYMLRTSAGVCNTESLSSEYTESLYFGILPLTISTTGGHYFSDTAEGFISKDAFLETASNATGSSTTTFQNNFYLDGQYNYSINGGAPTADSTLDSKAIRETYEINILSDMVDLTHIASAEMEDQGDFLVISFDGNDTFDQFYGGYMAGEFGFHTPLGSLVDSYTTEEAGGYLVINKYTGLTTAMGLFLERSVTHLNASYSMTWHKDQSLTLACSNAYETITGEPAPQTSEEAITPLFYQVTGSNGQKLWLLGTTDIGDGRSANLPASILDALATSTALALEYDPDAFAASIAADATLQSQLAAVYYYENSTTAKHLPKELYARMEPLMRATGLYNTNSLYLKPVIWQSQIENFYLTQSYGLNANSGSTQILLELAHQQDLSIYQIESGLSQLQILTGFSDALQAMLLQRLLDQGMTGYYDGLAQKYELWCQGDADGLLALSAAATARMSDEEQKLYEEYYKAVVTDRTKVMLNAATGYLESGETVFCAVNLDNLLGTDGLVEALRTAGYTVEAVQYE